MVLTINTVGIELHTDDSVRLPVMRSGGPATDYI
jgi:hypothetical protein